MSGSREPYNSWGNGSAMRVSPVGFAFDTSDSVLQEARRSAEVTHNHPEGIKGDASNCTSIFMARSGHSKAEIRQAISTQFQYDLDRTVRDIRPKYEFNESCQETVPEAIIAFLDSEDYETQFASQSLLVATRTLSHASLEELQARSMAESRRIFAGPALARLDPPLRDVVDRFCNVFGVPAP